MRTTGAAIEPGGYAGAHQRVLDQAAVLLRRTHQDRHLIEADASLLLRELPRSGHLVVVALQLAEGAESFLKELVCLFRLSKFTCHDS